MLFMGALHARRDRGAVGARGRRQDVGCLRLYGTEEVTPSACRMKTTAPAKNQASAESDEVTQLLLRTYPVEHRAGREPYLTWGHAARGSPCRFPVPA